MILYMIQMNKTIILIIVCNLLKHKIIETQEKHVETINTNKILDKIEKE